MFLNFKNIQINKQTKDIKMTISIQSKMKTFKQVSQAKTYLAKFSKIAKKLNKKIDVKIAYDCKSMLIGVIRS